MGSVFLGGFRFQRLQRPNAGMRQINGIAPIGLAEYVTVKYTSTDGINPLLGRDLLVKFSRPYTFFWVASDNSTGGIGAWVHFWPNYYPVKTGVTQIIPNGGERMFDFTCGANAATTPEKYMSSRFFKSRVPIDHFYVDIDHPSGGGVTISTTFGGSNIIEKTNFCRL